jgi:aspartyl-tRNA(Asn)/glutamyl-tRNA(Gln) amidotransferase subunit C
MVNLADLKKLESLIKIKLTDCEKTAAVEFLNSHAVKFDKLAGIDTENTEPLITVSSLENVMREDRASKIISREELLASAPEQRDGYIVVPKILERTE